MLKYIMIASIGLFFMLSACEVQIYLKTIGFSVVLIGVLEGIAEATAGLSKGYFGKLSDISGKRALFGQTG